MFAKVYHKNRGDDVDSNDIMAYSALNADAGGDDEPAFGAGGAIMEALAQSNPDIADAQVETDLNSSITTTLTTTTKNLKPVSIGEKLS